MLQACWQGVDLKVDRRFGEGQAEIDSTPIQHSVPLRSWICRALCIAVGVFVQMIGDK
jgi:hypothetical protein